MLSRLVILIALLGMPFGLATGAPARPRYEPQTEKPTVDLRGTAWQGSEPADRAFYFHGDGQLSYFRGDKGFGSWRLEGDVLYFEFNQKFREFRGTIQDGVIRGESWNIKGKRWLTVLKRTAMPR